MALEPPDILMRESSDDRAGTTMSRRILAMTNRFPLDMIIFPFQCLGTLSSFFS